VSRPIDFTRSGELDLAQKIVEQFSKNNGSQFPVSLHGLAEAAA
jgi:hypothetical protein